MLFYHFRNVAAVAHGVHVEAELCGSMFHTFAWFLSMLAPLLFNHLRQVLFLLLQHRLLRQAVLLLLFLLSSQTWW